MKINQINNTTFGIKCIKPEKWNKDVYNTLMNSNLTKDIDRKYPKASASYYLFKNEDLANDEPIYTLLFDINLGKNQIWHFWQDSHTESVLPKALSANLQNLTLEKVESELNRTSRKNVPVKIEITAQKENPVKKFFKKIFG